MTHRPIGRPGSDEHGPYYARYIDLVPDGDVVEVLRDQLRSTTAVLAEIPEEQAGHRYAPGKWSIKEVVGHVVETEIVFIHRALWFARRFPSALPGFEQDDSVSAAGFDRWRFADLVRWFRVVRETGLVLFESFDEETWRARGTANEVTFSVRAVPYIVAGHERHHVAVIRERYLRTRP